MEKNRKENAVKTEDTSAKKTESRKISDDDADQVSGGRGNGCPIETRDFAGFRGNPIRPVR